MQNTIQTINTVSHPLIDDTYLKKTHDLNGQKHEILVIESSARDENSTSYMDLLTDLNDVLEKAKNEAGSFDYIDIRLN